MALQFVMVLLAAAYFRHSTATESQILKEAEKAIQTSIFGVAGVGIGLKIDNGKIWGCDVLGKEVATAELDISALKATLKNKQGGSEAIAEKVVNAIVTAIQNKLKNTKVTYIACATKLVANPSAAC